MIPLRKKSHTRYKGCQNPQPGPEINISTFSYRSRVESVVNNVLDVLSLSDLLHELVLVPVHAGQITNVSEYVLQTVR